jgi:hypothetical protein
MKILNHILLTEEELINERAIHPKTKERISRLAKNAVAANTSVNNAWDELAKYGVRKPYDGKNTTSKLIKLTDKNVWDDIKILIYDAGKLTNTLTDISKIDILNKKITIRYNDDPTSGVKNGTLVFEKSNKPSEIEIKKKYDNTDLNNVILNTTPLTNFTIVFNV